MDKPYSNPFEHLRDELKRIKILLQRAVAINRIHSRSRLPLEAAFRGHSLEPEHVDAILAHDDLLAARFEIPVRDQSEAKAIQELEDKASDMRAAIDLRVAASAAAGQTLPLSRLISEFDMIELELEILLLAIAPELDPAFEKIYAELHDDVTRTRPSVDLTLQVLCRDEVEKLRARTHLSPGALLFHFRFLTMADERHSGGPPTLLNRLLIPDDSVVRYVAGQPPGTLAAGRILASSAEKARKLSVASRTRVDQFTEAVMRHDPEHFTLVIEGDRAEMRLSAAVLAAHALGRPLLLLDSPGEILSAGALLTATRDAALWAAILTVQMPPVERKAREGASKEGAEDGVVWPSFIEFNRRPVILLNSENHMPPIPWAGTVWRLVVEPPAFEERLEIWRQAAPALEDAHARFLADNFQFSEDQVRSAQALAYGQASLRNPSNPAITGEDLLEASRGLSSPNLHRFAISLRPRYGWKDLVLPEGRMEQLRGIADRMRTRATVLRDWGFGTKHNRGNGLNVLFTGGSGTGKTMAAEVLARELSLELFQIDLSSVVSKYIGDTEKHLAAIFDEAQLGNVLLLFDEADSLFGKRTELKDAHDRYANIEINYLLQRFERYQGLCVLSTNMQKNIDDAFLRRLHEVVDFPFPAAQSRERIWRSHVPKEAPLDAGVDFNYLSQQFKLAGGNISNVARNAAYLAAAQK
ncbi:MAG: ATP-binding protein, partial [Acidobacteriota bacterium]